MRWILALIASLALSMVCGSGSAQQKLHFPSLDGKDGVAATELDGYLFSPDGPGPHPGHRVPAWLRRTDLRARPATIVSRETAWRQSSSPRASSC